MIFKSGESHLEAQDLADKIKELHDEEFQEPFPYDGCRWLKGEFEAELDSLIPDLDLWVINHIGFASRGRQLLEFSREQALRASGLVSLSFYEQHPEYAWLRRHIDVPNTPDLVEYLAVSDRLRVMLLSLFDFMLREEFVELPPPNKRLERTRRSVAFIRSNLGEPLKRNVRWLILGDD